MPREIFNIAMAAACFAILVYREHINTTESTIIAVSVFALLELHNRLKSFTESYPKLPFAYKAELVITPDFRELMRHPFVKSFYEKALPIVDVAGSASRFGERSLWKETNLRFLLLNGLYWSDVHKTFFTNLRFASRILDFDLSEDDLEPSLDFELKNGFLRFWFSSGKFVSDREPQLICEFPLFIYEDIPTKAMDMRFNSAAWNDFVKLRKLSSSPSSGVTTSFRRKLKKSREIQMEVLIRYGFKAHTEGDTDVYQDRDGEHQVYDPNDGFDGFKNSYFTIQFKEFVDG